RRLAHGMTIPSNYTWAHSLGDLFRENEAGFNNYFTLRNRKLNKGPIVFDLRHAWQTYFSYQLPFGKGHALASGAVLNAIAGGWTIGGIFRGQTGRPFRLGSNFDMLNQYDSGVILNGGTADHTQNK